MKIAVSSDDGKTVCGHFGRCNVFIVFDVVGDRIRSKEFRRNYYIHRGLGEYSSDHKPDERNLSHQEVLWILNDCHSVVSQGMGRNVIDDLKEKNIEPIITDEVNAETAVQAYIEGKLVNRSERIRNCQ